ncbi:hypothetical protein A4F85_06685 [Delftia sp. GW456-R20]|nr:hypothetical protein A4F85_06685 [Delftia sp. GW456-R20]
MRTQPKSTIYRYLITLSESSTNRIEFTRLCFVDEVENCSISCTMKNIYIVLMSWRIFRNFTTIFHKGIN